MLIDLKSTLERTVFGRTNQNQGQLDRYESAADRKPILTCAQMERDHYHYDRHLRKLNAPSLRFCAPMSQNYCIVHQIYIHLRWREIVYITFQEYLKKSIAPLMRILWSTLLIKIILDLISKFTIKNDNIPYLDVFCG